MAESPAPWPTRAGGAPLPRPHLPSPSRAPGSSGCCRIQSPGLNLGRRQGRGQGSAAGRPRCALRPQCRRAPRNPRRPRRAPAPLALHGGHPILLQVCEQPEARGAAAGAGERGVRRAAAAAAPLARRRCRPLEAPEAHRVGVPDPPVRRRGARRGIEVGGERRHAAGARSTLMRAAARRGAARGARARAAARPAVSPAAPAASAAGAVTRAPSPCPAAERPRATGDDAGAAPLGRAGVWGGK
jgi:hypothetical protein